MRSTPVARRTALTTSCDVGPDGLSTTRTPFIIQFVVGPHPHNLPARSLAPLLGATACFELRPSGDALAVPALPPPPRLRWTCGRRLVRRVTVSSAGPRRSPARAVRESWDGRRRGAR